MKLELLDRLPANWKDAARIFHPAGAAAPSVSAVSAESLRSQLLMRWRQLRRQFDSRLPNERRLIILAAIALLWFALDTTLITPGNEAWHRASARLEKATRARDAMQAELQRKREEMARRLLVAEHERVAVRQRLADGQQELDREQSMMAPAREMRGLLEGLLAQHGGLQLQRMVTLQPKEVRIGGALQEASSALLFNHGMEISVSGNFLELLSWLRGVETLPKRLMWDSLELHEDEQGKLTLTLVLHTFSPDRDTLEMAP